MCQRLRRGAEFIPPNPLSLAEHRYPEIGIIPAFHRPGAGLQNPPETPRGSCIYPLENDGLLAYNILSRECRTQDQYIGQFPESALASIAAESGIRLNTRRQPLSN